MRRTNTTALRALQFGTIALATVALTACGGSNGGGSSATATIKGTAAVGAALPNAAVTLTCKNGSDSTNTDANGSYTATFNFDPPCAITASNGTITIHSLAAGSGTYNVTPLTELMLSYIAGQLGTTESGLLAGITTNADYQKALTNSTVIANAEAAVVNLIKTMYGITLSSGSFLTVSFTPGQGGADADLDTLLSVGAITTTGQPSASLVSAAVKAGQASPISATSGGSTGGTGGSGGSGTVTQ